VAGGGAGIASAAIGFNPALAVNPAVLATIGAVTSIGASVTSDIANGQPVHVGKAALSGVAGAVAGPLGSKAGNAVEQGITKAGGSSAAGSVAAEAAGAIVGEASSAGVSTSAGVVEAAAHNLAGVGKNAASELQNKVTTRPLRKQELR